MQNKRSNVEKNQSFALNCIVSGRFHYENRQKNWQKFHHLFWKIDILTIYHSFISQWASVWDADNSIVWFFIEDFLNSNSFSKRFFCYLRMQSGVILIGRRRGTVHKLNRHNTHNRLTEWLIYRSNF